MTEHMDRAVESLRRARRILVFTGAGISTESGIPDFRGPNGLWSKVDPDDFTIGRYLAAPEVRIRSWGMHRRGELWGARSRIRPNPAHHAVTALWNEGRCAGVITQNIDGLHLEAGISPGALSEIHGNIRRSHCVGCKASWPTETVLEWVDSGQEDPRCPDCSGIVKTATVMFGELLPDEEIAKAEFFSAAADAVLVIGSTLSVYPAADFAIRVRMTGCPMVIINLGPTDQDHLATVSIDAPAGSAVPELVRALS
ncbi:MAG TPA: Sir2 family NAD-dependent protein deacetylase [Acidimicrobiia bacterium]